MMESSLFIDFLSLTDSNVSILCPITFTALQMSSLIAATPGTDAVSPADYCRADGTELHSSGPPKVHHQLLGFVNVSNEFSSLELNKHLLLMFLLCLSNCTGGKLRCKANFMGQVRLINE